MGFFTGMLRATMGGSMRRITTGVGVGGLIGGAQSDWSAEGVVGGMALGGTAGLMTARVPFYRNAAGKAVDSPMVGSALGGDLLKASPRIAWGAGKMGYKAGKFAWNHPLMAAGIGIGGYAALSGGAPNSQAMSAMAMAGGTSQGSLSPVFRQSADGLVQGLHKGRH